MATINLGIHIVISVLTNEGLRIKHYIGGILYSRGTTEYMPNCSPLWFLTAIFVASIIIYFINSIDNIWLRNLIVIICPFISYGLEQRELFKLPWNIDSALMAVPFIIIGIIIREIKMKISIGGDAILVLVGFGIIKKNSIMVSFDNNQYGKLHFMILGALLVCIAVIGIAQRISEYYKCTYLAWLGQHTIFIMGFDYFSGTIAKVVLSILGIENWLFVFCLKLIELSLGILIWREIIDRIPNDKLRRILQF